MFVKKNNLIYNETQLKQIKHYETGIYNIAFH